MSGVLKSWNAKCKEKLAGTGGGGGALLPKRFTSVLRPVGDIQIPACNSGTAGVLV